MTPIRSLFLAREVAGSPVGGGTWRVLQNLAAASSLGPTSLISLHRSPIEDQPSSSTIATRHDFTVRKAKDKFFLGSRAWMLRRRGHPWADIHFDPAIESEIARILESFRPDVLIVAELWLARYLDRLRKSRLPIVLDEFNCESFVSEWEAAGLAEDLDDMTPRRRALLQVLARRTRRLEGWALRRADHVWVTTPGDAARLRRLFSFQAPTTVVPNTIDADYYRAVRERLDRSRSAGSPGPASILFVGNLGYAPNRMAVQNLLTEVMPAIRRQVGRRRVTIIGKDPGGTLARRTAADPDIEVTGHVEDVRAHFSEDQIAVLPLPMGGASRLKILEAFATGIPVVTTSDGIEDVAATPGAHLLIGDTPEEIAGAFARLDADPRERSRLARAALSVVTQSYSATALAPAVKESFRLLLEGAVE